MKKSLFILALVLGMASSALANPNKMAEASEAKFKQMDTNSDGQVTIEEFKALYPTMKANVFDIIDSTNDNVIDMKEWLHFQDQHMSGMKSEEGKKAMSKSPGDAGGRGVDSGMQPAENHPGGNMLIMPPTGN